MSSPQSTPYAALDSLETGGKPEPTYQHLTNPCVLSWNNLSYSVACRKTAAAPDGKKTILDHVSGRCAPGELTA
ncbi:hypothetical protein PF004_g30725, partial [Phytophthora fragariae]